MSTFIKYLSGASTLPYHEERNLVHNSTVYINRAHGRTCRYVQRLTRRLQVTRCCRYLGRSIINPLGLHR